MSDTMRYLSVGLNVRGKRCLVIGGGNIGLRRTKTLLRAGADVTVVSPRLHPELALLAKREVIVHTSRPYLPGHDSAAFLTVAATNVREVNVMAAKEAQQAKQLANIVDVPEEGNVIFPATIALPDGVVIAIHTSGASPKVTKRLKDLLAEDLANGTHHFVDELRRLARPQ